MNEPAAAAARAARPMPLAEWQPALEAAYDLAAAYLTALPDSPVRRDVSPEEMARRFNNALPEFGCAPEDAVREWFSRAEPGIVHSPGPRYFGFVTGGATPAALAGDWLASAIDQNPATWLLSPAAAQTEQSVIRWLLDLFAIPKDWSGVLTTGATMSNLCGLAAARQWASERLGFDAARDGLAGQPAIPVVGSVEVHQSARKALSTLGLGRETLRSVSATDGSIDVGAFGELLAGIGDPVIVIANAGEVNTGAFDKIRALAERCADHAPGAWLHVDGAFGLYAALAPSHAHLVDGIDLADSIATDAHKWLNVPYDCGAVFVRDERFLRNAFAGTAAYLNANDDEGIWDAYERIPEFSRRFRALSVWCALRSAGRQGYREIVEHCIDNAHHFADWVTDQPFLELLAPARLNIVCFRYLSETSDDAAHDALTEAALNAIQRGGEAFVSATRWAGHGAIRAAFDNWATGPEDVLALQRAIDSAHKKAVLERVQ